MGSPPGRKDGSPRRIYLRLNPSPSSLAGKLGAVANLSLLSDCLMAAECLSASWNRLASPASERILH